MSTLESIIKNQVEFVVNSGYTVNVDVRMDTVSIEHSSDDEDLSVFLDGSNASQFIKNANKVWENCDNITEEESYLAEAKQYIENM